MVQKNPGEFSIFFTRVSVVVTVAQFGKPTMKTSLQILNDVHIPKPCHENWDAMSGNDRQRHCDSCNHAVHYLSNMSAKEAADLLTNRNGSICIRIDRKMDGTVATDERSRWRRWISKSMVAMISWVGLGMLLGCEREREEKSTIAGTPEPEKIELKMTMGKLCPPVQPIQNKSIENIE
jgi:hypothetical protein